MTEMTLKKKRNDRNEKIRKEITLKKKINDRKEEKK